MLSPCLIFGLIGVDVMVSISYPETKDQWARDDPAFLVLLSIWLCGKLLLVATIPLTSKLLFTICPSLTPSPKATFGYPSRGLPLRFQFAWYTEYTVMGN